MLTMGAAGQDRVPFPAGQLSERTGQLAQIAQQDGVGCLDLHHQPGIGHVLGGRTPVDVAAGIAFTDRRQLPDQRHQLVGRIVDALTQREEVDVLNARLARDLGRSAGRHQTDCRFRTRQCRFEIKPALQQRLIAEHGPQLVGAVHVAEND